MLDRKTLDSLDIKVAGQVIVENSGVTIKEFHIEPRSENGPFAGKVTSDLQSGVALMATEFALRLLRDANEGAFHVALARMGY